ncbi:MAG: precorrin-6A/cobalt-precorrin-6A reductase [Pseudomonadota bacterium]
MRMLLLAGTAEGAQIARALAREERVVATASLARATPTPMALGLPTRIGGWGSEEAFRVWLHRERIDAVLDATNPFAVGITERTARVCADEGVALLQFLRRSWTPGRDDRWEFLNVEADAAKVIPADARVLLSTGQRGLERFDALADRVLYARVPFLPDAPFPYPHGGYVVRPPGMPVAAEEALLHALDVTWIVARNSGSASGMAKLEAARRLGLSVAMIRRPPQPEIARISTVAEALSWVRRRL